MRKEIIGREKEQEIFANLIRSKESDFLVHRLKSYST